MLRVSIQSNKDYGKKKLEVLIQNHPWEKLEILHELAIVNFGQTVIVVQVSKAESI